MKHIKGDRSDHEALKAAITGQGFQVVYDINGEGRGWDQLAWAGLGGAGMRWAGRGLSGVSGRSRWHGEWGMDVRCILL